MKQHKGNNKNIEKSNKIISIISCAVTSLPSRLANVPPSRDDSSQRDCCREFELYFFGETCAHTSIGFFNLRSLNYIYSNNSRVIHTYLHNQRVCVYAKSSSQFTHTSWCAHSTHTRLSILALCHQCRSAVVRSCPV